MPCPVSNTQDGADRVSSCFNDWYSDPDPTIILLNHFLTRGCISVLQIRLKRLAKSQGPTASITPHPESSTKRVSDGPIPIHPIPKKQKPFPKPTPKHVLRESFLGSKPLALPLKKITAPVHFNLSRWEPGIISCGLNVIQDRAKRRWEVMGQRPRH